MISVCARNRFVRLDKFKICCLRMDIYSYRPFILLLFGLQVYFYRDLMARYTEVNELVAMVTNSPSAVTS